MLGGSIFPGTVGRGGRVMVVRLHRRCLVKLCEQSSGGIHDCKGSDFTGSRRFNVRRIEVTPLRSLGVWF